MSQGKVRNAINLLSRNSCQGILNPDDTTEEIDSNGVNHITTVKEMLRSLHPQGKQAPDEILIAESPDAPLMNSVLFDEINAESIRRAALSTQGGAGPSGVDALGWRRFCTSFKSASTDLCRALAAVAHRLATEKVRPEGLEAFVACRLITLNKNPGVRPIGIGEVPRRIVAKAILKVTIDDIQSATGPLQVCAGHEAGIEAAIHTMRMSFDNESSEAILLVDASNAFNTINREALIHNIGKLCPSMSNIVYNTYQTAVRMFVSGRSQCEILSTEGTTQGDPLSMAIYALGITPLIQQLHHLHSSTKQAWFADDASACATCEELWNWWDELTKIGPCLDTIQSHLKPISL